ncbi:MAG: hypothetical protein PHV61_00400 [Limnochordia bacterium]|nr:hypothetical protein [Limnochordia bacterium]MDD2628620.1 hypothetical protein [Limnochordia bacterium]MDD4518125.1 hypothetical protein [Limnochordia bacterium]
MRRFTLFLVLTIILSGVVGHAQQQYSLVNTFGIVPAEYREDLSPGASKEYKLTLVNNTQRTQTYKIESNSVGLDRSGQQYYLDAGYKMDNSAVDWVRFLNLGFSGEVMVEAGQEASINVQVNVPYGVLPGVYYAMVFAEPTEYSVAGQGALTTMSKSRVGALLRITIPGPEAAFNVYSTVDQLTILEPDPVKVELYQRMINYLRDFQEITAIATELSSILADIGYRLDQEAYTAMSEEDQGMYCLGLADFLAELKMEEQSIRIMATLQTSARKMIVAQGEAFVYEEYKDESGRTHRRLLDRFLLTPVGSNIKGQGSIFPGGLRDFTGSVHRPLAAGEYALEVKFEYGEQGAKYRRIALGQQGFTVTEDIARQQRDILTLDVDKELLQYVMVPGGFHVETVVLENLDLVESMEVLLVTNVEWLRVSTEACVIPPGRTKTIAIAARVPRDVEKVQGEGNVFIVAKTGKTISVDVKLIDARIWSSGGTTNE